ncbi:hypothetical protein [Kangiella aquimarina]|uniref:Riboflavin biosynthesis intermediates N-glycosidase n=1 Tax=Kangiella aquimarina TaxID=261965 RepID=A0ABZ0X201_9GAMM|nr:hypothetical protein [Kangiella aquimarina]WQG84401.1 hypothetical protein SR900_07975 [Kangiella aquimarina]
MNNDLFLQIIEGQSPKLTLAYNNDDNCWGWYGHDGMRRYVFHEMKNQEVLSSAEYYFEQNLLRKIKDVYAVENGSPSSVRKIR